jgi:biopolymer transport protein ExbD
MMNFRIFFFALILFSVACSEAETSQLKDVIANLDKAKTMETPIPKDTTSVTLVDTSANTILIDGNKDGKFYVYHGQFDSTMNPSFVLAEYTSAELRRYILSEKKKAVADTAQTFIVKWGGDAKYNTVIDVIDELKSCNISKYALTKISKPELQKLAAKTGRKYPELSESH